MALAGSFGLLCRRYWAEKQSCYLVDNATNLTTTCSASGYCGQRWGLNDRQPADADA